MQGPLRSAAIPLINVSWTGTEEAKGPGVPAIVVKGNDRHPSRRKKRILRMSLGQKLRQYKKKKGGILGEIKNKSSVGMMRFLLPLMILVAGSSVTLQAQQRYLYVATPGIRDYLGYG